MSTSNEDLVRKGYEAMMRGDLAAVTELMSPELTWHAREHGPWDCQSREEALAVIREQQSDQVIGELKTIKELDAEHVVVVVGLRADRKTTNEDLGLPEGQDETANLVTIRDGKVIALHDYLGEQEAAEAIGLEE